MITESIRSTHVTHTGARLDEVEAAIASQMFDWYLEPGVTLYRVARRLTDLGLATPAGKKTLEYVDCARILTNHAYTEAAYANRLRVVPPKRRLSVYRSVGKGKSAVQRPKEEWVPILVPSVVTRDVFEQVQAKPLLNQKKAPRNNKAHQYLLRGLISCGKCRLSAYARTLHEKYHYYVCKGHTNALRTAPGERRESCYVPVSQLDELVWQDLADVLTQPESVAYELERAHGGHWAPQELRARIDSLSKAAKSLERRQARLLGAYLVDVIALPKFERKRNQLGRKRHSLATQCLQLETTIGERVELSGVASSIESFCARVRPILEHPTFVQRRQPVELLVDRVVVTEKRVEIRYVSPT